MKLIKIMIGTEGGRLTSVAPKDSSILFRAILSCITVCGCGCVCVITILIRNGRQHSTAQHSAQRELRLSLSE